MIRVMSYLEKKHKVGGEMGLAVIEICFDSYLFFSPTEFSNLGVSYLLNT